jgi:hypothetical protein
MKRKFALILLLVIPLIAGVVVGHGVRAVRQPGPEQIASMLSSNPELVDHFLTANPELVDNLLRAKVPHVDMFLGTDLQPVETAFEDWIYPDSKSLGSGSSMSGEHNGMPFEFHSRADVRTDDDFETVIAYYSEKFRAALGLGDDDDWGLSPRGSGSAGVDGVLVAYTIDDGRDRPVQIGDVGLQAENCNLHLMITRGEGEAHTYISLLFSRWSVEQPQQGTP